MNAREDAVWVADTIAQLRADNERLRQDVAWKANIIKAADTEMERLRGLCRAAGVEPTQTSAMRMDREEM